MMMYRRVEEGYTTDFTYGNQHLFVPPVALVACFGKPSRLLDDKERTVFRTIPGLYLFKDEDDIIYAITVSPYTHLDVVKAAPEEKKKFNWQREWKKNPTEDGFWNSDEPYQFDVDAPEDNQEGLARFVRWVIETMENL